MNLLLLQDQIACVLLINHCKQARYDVITSALFLLFNSIAEGGLGVAGKRYRNDGSVVRCRRKDDGNHGFFFEIDRCW